MTITRLLGFFITGVLLFTSCDDEDSGAILAPTGLKLIDPGANITLTTDMTGEENILQLNWNDEENVGGPFEVSISGTEDFMNPIQIGTSTDDSFLIKSGELLVALNQTSVPVLQSSPVYFRVQAGEVLSNTIVIPVNFYPTENPVIASPEANASFDLTMGGQSDVAFTMEVGDYTIGTDYTVQVEAAAAGTDFASPISGPTFNNTQMFELTNQQVNNMALAAGITPTESGSFDVRVAVTSGDIVRYSDPITITVTTFDVRRRLAVPGDHQGWNPDPNAVDFVPFVAAPSATSNEYEGYMVLQNEYKFVTADADGNFQWGNEDYGDLIGPNGVFSGILINEGEFNCGIPSGSPGDYFRVEVNLETLEYVVTPTQWGVIGSATPSGWDADTDLTYNESTRVWEATMDLVVGEYKFRANDDWAINFGPDTDGDGSLNYGGFDNFQVTQAGTYKITLDLSEPRVYTQSIQLQ